MSKLIVQDQQVFMGSYELTGRSNAVTLDYSSELQDDTVLGDDTRSRLGGLKDTTFTLEGYVDLDDDAADKYKFDNIGVSNIPVTVFTSSTVGTTAYFFNGIFGNINNGASVGEMLTFSAEAMARGGDGLIRGTSMLNASASELSASGNGTAYELGATATGQTLYASLHVLEVVTAGTLDVTITSDTSGGGSFSTTQLTFAQATAIGSEIVSKAGSITDTFLRCDYAIGGGGEFKFVVACGII